MNANHEHVETALDSHVSQEVSSQVELAQDMLLLMQSEGFMEKLREFVKEEMVGDVFANIRGRMNMSDIMEFLDASEAESRTLLSGKF